MIDVFRHTLKLGPSNGQWTGVFINLQQPGRISLIIYLGTPNLFLATCHRIIELYTRLAIPGTQRGGGQISGVDLAYVEDLLQNP